MRFLLGICVGAVMTLFIATVIDAPTNPIVEKLTFVWDKLITVTGENLFRQTDTARAIQAPEADNRKTAVRVLPATPGQSLPSAVESLLSAGESLPAANATTPTTVMAPLAQPLPPGANPGADPTPAIAFVSHPVREISPPDIQAILDNPLLLPDYAPSSVSAPPLADPQARTFAATAPVWTPFHSEVSARGFANRLSEQIEHPFAVERQGPGAYQVVFSYSSPGERDVVLAEVSALTGL